MLEVVFDFMRQGIIPWDAKLDNLWLAKRGAHGKWVFGGERAVQDLGQVS